MPPPPLLKLKPAPPVKQSSKKVVGKDFLSELKSKRNETEPEKALPDESLFAPKMNVFEKFICPRCEKEVLENERVGHANSHSSEIFPYLFLGGMRNAHNKKELVVRTGVHYILNLAEEVENIFESCYEGCECTSGGPECNRLIFGNNDKIPKLLTYYNRKVKDAPGEDLLSFFEESFQLIETVQEQYHGKILVHCIAGISRSATVVIAFCMRKMHWSLKKAFEYVKGIRTIVSPIAYFIEQLQRYEERLGQLYLLDGYTPGQPSLRVQDIYHEGVIYINNLM